MSLENVPSFLLNFSEAEMNGKEKLSYQFKSFRLEIGERQLLRGDMSVPLTPKAFDVLAFLVERAGHLVEKEELMQSVWSDSFVEEANLARIVHTLRKTLGQDNNGNKFIETVAKKGYRFVAKVEEVNRNGAEMLPFEPHVDPISENGEELGSNDIRSSSINGNSNIIQETSRRGHPRTLTILAVALFLTVTATGFWFANESGVRVRGLKGITPQTNNGEALQHYQQGRFFTERKHKGDLEKALASFEKAIDLDPNYAAAYVGKADAKIWTFWDTASHEDISQTRTAINKAIELDESNSYAHTLLCRILGTYEWDFSGAEQECKRAVELDPKDHEARRELSFLFNVLGREYEAMREIDAAVTIAPTSFNKRSRGLILYYSRRYDEAIEQLQQVEDTDPNYHETDKWLVRSYEMKKDFPRAFECYLRQRKRVGAAPNDLTVLKTTYEQEGWPGILRKMIDEPGKNILNTAQIYAQLGDTEKAFESLNNAFDRRGVMVTLSAREPRFDPIRNDPRFDDLLRRIGLMPDATK